MTLFEFSSFIPATAPVAIPFSIVLDGLNLYADGASWNDIGRQTAIQGAIYLLTLGILKGMPLFRSLAATVEARAAAAAKAFPSFLRASESLVAGPRMAVPEALFELRGGLAGRVGSQTSNSIADAVEAGDMKLLLEEGDNFEVAFANRFAMQYGGWRPAYMASKTSVGFAAIIDDVPTMILRQGVEEITAHVVHEGQHLLDLVSGGLYDQLMAQRVGTNFIEAEMELRAIQAEQEWQMIQAVYRPEQVVRFGGSLEEARAHVFAEYFERGIHA